MALFHLLRACKIPFGALHFRHDGCLDFAGRSLDFCRELCDRHGVALETRRIEGRALAQRGDLSWEAACRKLRYAALEGREGTFLTAHTTDDQAETVVMRLLGGAGLSGLAGIRQLRDDGVVRPLLQVQRKELREYLRAQGAAWLDDPSNEGGNERALVRHTVLPFLLEQKPHLLNTLGRTARRLAEDEDFLSCSAVDWLEKHTLEGRDNWWLSDVQGLHPALLARFVRAVWQAMSGEGYRPRATLFEECFRMIERGTNEAEVLFPGGWGVQILGKKLWVRPSLPDATWEMTLTDGQEDAPVEVSRAPIEDADGWSVPEGAVLRSRRPDDRFLGKDLKKLLAGTGHPPWVRNRWPVLEVDGEVVAVWRLGAVDRLKSDPDLWVRFKPWSLRAKV